ncbi:hypothetical protein BH10ACI3_BH10ACI3_16340 [soil metagenome]
MNFSLPQAIELLGRTPVTLAALLSDLSPAWVESGGDRTNWDPITVVGHLIHADETDWIPRAEVILKQSADCRFSDFDRFGQFEKSEGRSLDRLLADFAAIRKASLETLDGWQLNPEMLTLTGIHPEFGEVTLEQLLATWVVHDLGHIRQIVSYLAAKYGNAVGPWKQYLSILK